MTEDNIHTRMQYILSKLGSDMGYNVWVATNDKNKSYCGKNLSDIKNILFEIPGNISNGYVKKIIERIDVVWFKNTYPKYAFEIENTTQIYSGLIRLSDLMTINEETNIKFKIVCPDDRFNKVINEINRPTFKFLFNNKVSIIKYSDIEELKEHKGKFSYDAKIIDEMSEYRDIEDIKIYDDTEEKNEYKSDINSNFNLYHLNSDTKYNPEILEEMLNKSFLYTHNLEKDSNHLGRLNIGDYVALYVNKMGYVAVGKVKSKSREIERKIFVNGIQHQYVCDVEWIKIIKDGVKAGNGMRVTLGLLKNQLNIIENLEKSFGVDLSFLKDNSSNIKEKHPKRIIRQRYWDSFLTFINNKDNTDISTNKKVIHMEHFNEHNLYTEVKIDFFKIACQIVSKLKNNQYDKTIDLILKDKEIIEKEYNIKIKDLSNKGYKVISIILNNTDIKNINNFDEYHKWHINNLNILNNIIKNIGYKV